MTQRGDPLSEREEAVFDGLLRGRTSKQIARELGITPATERTHRQRVYVKLGISAYRSGGPPGARRGVELIRAALMREASRTAQERAAAE